MIHHPYITGALLAVGVIMAFACSLGLVVMRHTYQRMQFAAPVVFVTVVLITIAIWVEDPQWQARIKSALIAVVLFLMNAILTHATARAIRLRETDHLEVRADEHIPIVDEKGVAIAKAGEESG